jgi:hypothetical protein
MMLNLPFAYFQPDTVMPLASMIGAVGGVIMIFGRAIVRLARRSVRSRFRPSPPVS